MLFDFYYPQEQELTGWQLQLKQFTDDNFGGGIRDWASIHSALRALRVQGVEPEKAAALVSTRRAPGPLDALFGPPVVLLDVRDSEAFSQSRPDGAVNVPLYTRLRDPKTVYDWYRVISFALAFALRPPVRNPAFLEQVGRLVGGRKDTPILVICSTGGTLETAAERKIRNPRIPAPIFGQYGAASRGLVAAHELLVKGGYRSVSFVEGGYSAWTARKLLSEWDD